MNQKRFPNLQRQRPRSLSPGMVKNKPQFCTNLCASPGRKNGDFSPQKSHGILLSSQTTIGFSTLAHCFAETVFLGDFYMHEFLSVSRLKMTLYLHNFCVIRQNAKISRKIVKSTPIDAGPVKMDPNYLRNITTHSCGKVHLFLKILAFAHNSVLPIKRTMIEHNFNF